MKIIMQQHVSDETRSYAIDEVVEVSEAKAKYFIERGMAITVTPAAKEPEATTVEAPPERAVLPAARKR